MAETLRIEIPIEAVDETAAGLNSAIQGLKKLEKIYENAGKSAGKSEKSVTQFDRQAQKTEKGLAGWAKGKYEILLEARDRVAPVLSTLRNGMRSFAGKTWSVTMKAVDLITSPVRGILNLLKNPLFQAGAVLGVSIGLKDTIDTYKGFESAMSQVEAVSGASGMEMKKLTDKAKEMGATTKFTAQESAEAFNYMAMAGWKTEDMLGGIEGILNLAAASGENLSTTSDIVTDALTAFGMKAGDAGHFSDVMAAASSNANTNVSLMGETFKYAGAMAGTLKYSIEDVALATGLMANAGIKGNMAGTALNSIFTRLSTNTGGAADALNELGIAFFHSDGSARDFSDVMEELREATADFTDKQKANLGNTIAGTYAQKGFLAILNATTEDYKKLSDAVGNADGAAARMAETMMDNLQGSITFLQSAVDGVKISFGERMAPYLRKFVDWLTAQMPEVEQGLNDFMDGVERKIGRMQEKFQEISGTAEWRNADIFGKAKIAWDEFIAEPFSEWWDGAGKAKFAEVAQNIGSGIGAGLKAGIMALLGIDLGEAMDEGVSIGASFAKGFSEGFDFEAVSEKLWQGFQNLLSNAGKLLPGGEKADLSSVFSAILLGKIASPFIGLGRGAFSLGRAVFAPAAEGGTPLASSIIGSAAAGTGVMGGMASLGMIGTRLTSTSIRGFSGFLGSQAAGISGAGLVGAGALGVAGAAAGGMSVVSGAMDAYKAIKSDNQEESHAYGTSAGLKIGGAVTGAAIGTLILPGLGTAIGAGIGGIAGYIKGNEVKESYEAEVEEAEKAAANAQKVFEATGLSIDEVKFKNKALQEAMNDSGVSAEQFAKMFQEDCADVMKKAFGDVKLSLKEIKELAEKITFGKMKKRLEKFGKAAADTESSVEGLKNSVSEMEKQNWRVNLGVKMSKSELEKYKQSVSQFVGSAKSYIENKHYEVKTALDLIIDGEPDYSGIDSYYGNLQTQIAEKSRELNEVMDRAMEDGVISTEKIRLHDGTLQMSEAQEIESLQKQIAGITDKVSEAQSKAELQAIGIKRSGAALDADSFMSALDEVKAHSESAAERYQQALVVTLTDLNLRLEDGAITQQEYNKLFEEATSGYKAQIRELDVQAQSFGLDSIAEAYGKQLEGCLKYVDGDLQERLAEYMNKALTLNPDVESWSEGFVRDWFDLYGLNASEFQNVYAILKEISASVPQVDEEAISGLSKKKEMTLPADKWMDIRDNGTVGKGKTESPMLSTEKWLNLNIRDTDMSETYSQIDGLKKTTDSYVESAFSAGVNAKLPIDIEAAFNLLNPLAMVTATGGGSSSSTLIKASISSYVTGKERHGTKENPSKHAAGGFVTGRQLSWLAEEGYGEFVIPTNPSRRGRALELYEQAGAMLGISARAEGGYISGSIPAGALSNGEDKNVPSSYGGFTEGRHYGEAERDYDPSPMEPSGSMGKITAQVNVNVSPEFVIHGAGGQKEGDIVQAVKKHMKEIADGLGGEIAQRLDAVFSNKPLKEA